MKTLVNRRSLRGLMVASFAAVAACVAAGGYDRGASVGYGVDFYEPYGYDYGGWGPGYRVGPPRRESDRGGRGEARGRDEGHAAPHPAYRPAPPSRSMPSLPTHSRERER